jgi:hypothetical protein
MAVRNRSTSPKTCFHRMVSNMSAPAAASSGSGGVAQPAIKDAIAAKSDQASWAADVKAMALDAKKNKAEATKIMGKLGGELFQLDMIKKQKSVKNLPDVVVSKLSDTFNQVKQVLDECKAVLSGKSAVLNTSFAEACALQKTCGLQKMFVNQLLQSSMAANMP